MKARNKNLVLIYLIGKNAKMSIQVTRLKTGLSECGF
jgi:hypothetical protein